MEKKLIRLTENDIHKIVKETIETIMTKEQLIEFEQLTRPLIEYIRNYHHPHTKIIIDWDDATITNDAGGYNFDKSLSDLIDRHSNY